MMISHHLLLLFLLLFLTSIVVIMKDKLMNEYNNYFNNDNPNRLLLEKLITDTVQRILLKSCTVNVNFSNHRIKFSLENKLTPQKIELIKIMTASKYFKEYKTFIVDPVEVRYYFNENI